MKTGNKLEKIEVSANGLTLSLVFTTRVPTRISDQGTGRLPFAMAREVREVREVNLSGGHSGAEIARRLHMLAAIVEEIE